MPRKPEKIVEPIDAPFGAVVRAMVGVKPKSGTSNPISKGSDMEIVPYDNDGENIDFRLDPETQELWASVKIIAKLYGKHERTIYHHIEEIYKSEELQRVGSMSKYDIVQKEGPRNVTRSIEFYNLDMILSVGYRVNSKQATAFRQWSNKILRAYIEQGYVVNEELLRRHPEKADKLAAEIRAIRNNEKHIYAKVRECFKISSSDYDPTAKEVKSFYALLQDKFHHAITRMTASKIIMDRADYKEEHMGLQTFKGNSPRLKDAKIGKNYLEKEELYRMHLLSEQFLLYAESTALAKKKMTMRSLHNQLDRLLELNDYPVFDGYKDYLKAQAEKHAEIEYGLYEKRLILENLGIEYDEEDLMDGEYDEIIAENQSTKIAKVSN